MMKGCLLVIAGALAFALLILLTALAVFAFASRLPSDAQLIAQFQNHRSDLEQLRKMTEADKLDSRIGPGYVDDATLPPLRVVQYRTLMKSAGIVRLWSHGPGKPLELLAAGNGFLGDGEYKGYRYGKTQEQHIVKSLDESCQTPQKEARYCEAGRKLDADWWLIRYEYF